MTTPDQKNESPHPHIEWRNMANLGLKLALFAIWTGIVMGGADQLHLMDSGNWGVTGIIWLLDAIGGYGIMTSGKLVA